MWNATVPTNQFSFKATHTKCNIKQNIFKYVIFAQEVLNMMATHKVVETIDWCLVPSSQKPLKGYKVLIKCSSMSFSWCCTSCYSAPKSEVIVKVYHIKPDLSFQSLFWLINVWELTEGGDFVLFRGQIGGKRVWLRSMLQCSGVSQQCCPPQWAVGVWSCWLMDYSDICFIHSWKTLLQQPHCAPQKCSSTHREARLPISKMVTMQKPDKIWMLFILWNGKWGESGKKGRGLYNCKGMMSRGISIRAIEKVFNSQNNQHKTFRS